MAEPRRIALDVEVRPLPRVRRTPSRSPREAKRWPGAAIITASSGATDIAYAAAPGPVALPERAQDVAAGMHFSLALGESGHVYTWGWNAHGQLGLADTDDRHAPVRVPGLERVQSIAAGETHAVALTAEGLSAGATTPVARSAAPEPAPSPGAVAAVSPERVR